MPLDARKSLFIGTEVELITLHLPGSTFQSLEHACDRDLRAVLKLIDFPDRPVPLLPDATYDFVIPARGHPRDLGFALELHATSKGSYFGRLGIDDLLHAWVAALGAKGY